ncbi:MAG: TlyA family RNA methyltransferase [Ardenticatenaceae bacterium]|nr:TlyA family RNA methyltransferase [Ardenticatenaceae bacterium]MCB9443002.1 TlyA family RNA methyltransferase [Ardenticatenaceae bacterium]
MAKGKERLDKLLVARELVATRSKAQGHILAGEVLVDGERVDKPGTAVSLDAEITLKSQLPFVGRGGFKLDGALTEFEVVVNGRVCADVGACTGGFTDVLLQKGASCVYAIDVGYGQLDWNLRNDERVVVMERTNARYLDELAESVSFVCIDVSFISLKLILPAVQRWLTAEADIVALIKPQFEAGREYVGKGGIVKETAVHQAVLRDVLSWAQENGLRVAGLTRSSIEGADGNVEFLVWLQNWGVGIEDVDGLVTAVTHHPD